MILIEGHDIRRLTYLQSFVDTVLDILDFDLQPTHALIGLNRIKSAISGKQQLPIVGRGLALVDGRQCFDSNNRRIVYTRQNDGE